MIALNVAVNWTVLDNGPVGTCVCLFVWGKAKTWYRRAIDVTVVFQWYWNPSLSLYPYAHVRFSHILDLLFSISLLGKKRTATDPRKGKRNVLFPNHPTAEWRYHGPSSEEVFETEAWSELEQDSARLYRGAWCEGWGWCF